MHVSVGEEVARGARPPNHPSMHTHCVLSFPLSLCVSRAALVRHHVSNPSVCTPATHALVAWPHAHTLLILHGTTGRRPRTCPAQSGLWRCDFCGMECSGSEVEWELRGSASLVSPCTGVCLLYLCMCARGSRAGGRGRVSSF